MHRGPFVRARTLLAVVATAASLIALPGPSAAATCQAWGGPLPAIGDEWSRLADVAVISPCKAFAVGTFRDGGTERAPMQRWNGTKWSIVDLPDYGDLYDGLLGVSAAAANDIWAVGGKTVSGSKDRPLALHWNGTAWNEVPTPATGESKFYAVDVVASDDVWAVGQRYVDDVAQPLIERWNGVKWKVVPTPDTGDLGASLFGVDARGPNTAWAVGRRDDDGPQSIPLTMRWNGTAWRLRAAPTINDESHELDGVVTLSRSKAWAVGSAAGLGYTSILLRWNGKAWKAVAHPTPGDGSSQLKGLDATSATNVWAVGNSCQTGGRCDSLVLHWDGSGWVVQPSATSEDGTSLSGIDASSPTNAWAVGQVSAGSTSGPFAVHCC